MPTITQEFQRAIVKAAAHAETIAVEIEADQGHEYQVEFARTPPSVRRHYRFRNIETIEG